MSEDELAGLRDRFGLFPEADLEHEQEVANFRSKVEKLRSILGSEGCYDWVLSVGASLESNYSLEERKKYKFWQLMETSSYNQKTAPLLDLPGEFSLEKIIDEKLKEYEKN